jgi:hypothetical protein
MVRVMQSLDPPYYGHIPRQFGYGTDQITPHDERRQRGEEDDLTGLRGVANSDDLASIIKRHMVNAEHERLEDEEKVYTDQTRVPGRDLHANEADKLRMRINHLERLLAIRDMWGGVGGKSNAGCTTTVIPHRYTSMYHHHTDPLPDPYKYMTFEEMCMLDSRPSGQPGPSRETILL